MMGELLDQEVDLGVGIDGLGQNFDDDRIIEHPLLDLFEHDLRKFLFQVADLFPAGGLQIGNRRAVLYRRLHHL